jgi:hypothetical protein
MADDATLLPIWTVYDHPLDFPYGFVARKFDISGDGPVPTTDVLGAVTLAELRLQLPDGLTRIPRLHGDDPKIVEIWL